MESVLYFLAVFLMGLVAGAQLLGALILVPSARRLSEAGSLAFHQNVLDHKHDPYIGPVNAVGMATGILLLPFGDHSTTPLVFAALGVAATTATSALSILVSQSLNRKLRGFSADAVPPEYPDLRRRWDRYQYLRTALGVLAFAFFVAAAVAA